MIDLNIESPIFLIFGQFCIILIFFILWFQKKTYRENRENSGKYFLFRIFSDIKISLKKPILTIFSPVFLMGILYLLIRTYIPINTQNVNLGFLTILLLFTISVILAPLSEEIIQCLFLSSVFIILIEFFKKYLNYRSQITIYLILVTLLVIDALYMAYFHHNVNNSYFLLRGFAFVLYGVLYVINGRNLIPPVLAHASWNFLVTFNAI